MAENSQKKIKKILPLSFGKKKAGQRKPSTFF